MDVNTAGWLGLRGLRGVDDGYVLGAATLGVLDSGAGLVAKRAVLAGRSVRHVIVELQVAGELGLDGDGAQRELVNVGTATERRRLRLRAAARSADLLAVGTRSEPLSGILSATPSLPVEVVVVGKATCGEVGEVEASALLDGTLVVRVTRGREWIGIFEALQGD